MRYCGGNSSIIHKRNHEAHKMPKKLLTMNTHNSGIIKTNEAAGSKK